MTSADSLFCAYPVRFSAAAAGPWLDRGRYACLCSEHEALIELVVSVCQTLQQILW
jgi:hypothetical protein